MPWNAANCGGPSELAARDLTGDVPAGYWAKWSSGTTRRIREQTASLRCSCTRPGERLLDGRCGRCFAIHPQSEEPT